jgi:peptidoglycan/xylan/chitin deacetylase (PgdA/CDA1 family)
VSGARGLAVQAFNAGGGAAVCRSLYRDECVVLTYHGVVPTGSDPSVDQEKKFVLEADFVRQLEFIRKHYAPVSLEQFESACRGDSRLPGRALLVTIDDGYENAFTNMAPHLARLGIPAVLFVTTGFLGTGTTLWPNQVEMWWAGRKASSQSVNSSIPATLGAMKTRLKALPPAERGSLLREWLGDVGEDLPPGHVFRLMTWDQARQIERLGVALGSHTVTHAILAHEDDDAARREIADSRATLEAELGHPVLTFAYPNGGPGFFLPRDEKLLEECGYTVGFSMLRGRHEHGGNRYAIRRIAVGREEGWMPLFESRLAFPYGRVDRLRGRTGTR